MLKIAVCDDDKAVCTQIENILIDYDCRNSIKIDVSVFYTGESLLDYLNMGNNFDLIYLDIDSRNFDGAASFTAL